MRKKLDLANTVKVWRLDGEDLVSVRMIAGHAGYPYDFRPDDSGGRISLEDFMVSWEEGFPFAQTDVLDKWKVKTLNAETFNYYIDRAKLAVAGSLSATTTAKLIAYCLLIMEAEHEVLQTARVEALRNPVIKAGVNNAAVNRWGLGGKNRKKMEEASAGKVQFQED